MDKPDQSVIPDDVAALAYNWLREHEALPRYVVSGDKTRYTTEPYNDGEVSYFVVYDDKDKNNAWHPAKGGYDAWRSRLKGNPTLGYGMNFDVQDEQTREDYMNSGGYVGIDWIQRGLKSNAEDIMSAVYKRLPMLRKMTPEQHASLVSFYYNMGKSPQNKETIEGAIKRNDINGIYNALPLYNKSGGVVLKGLIKRREFERRAFAPNGRTAQPAPVATPAPGPRKQSNPAEHTIRPGDTVYKLWQEQKDGKTSWQDYQDSMRRLNPGIDFNKMKPGSTIRVK